MVMRAVPSAVMAQAAGLDHEQGASQGSCGMEETSVCKKELRRHHHADRADGDRQWPLVAVHLGINPSLDGESYERGDRDRRPVKPPGRDESETDQGKNTYQEWRCDAVHSTRRKCKRCKAIDAFA